MTTAVARVVIDIAGSVIGTTQVEPSAQSFDDAHGAHEYQDLANGANTITVPTSPAQATGVLIIPPAANIVTIALKGVAGDTGVGIAPASPTWLPFAATPPANFVLTCGGAIAGVLFVWI